MSIFRSMDLTLHLLELKYLVSYFFDNDNSTRNIQLLANGIIEWLDENNEFCGSNADIVQVYNTNKYVGHVLCIVGEVGTGKTFLVQNFANLIKQTSIFDIEFESTTDKLTPPLTPINNIVSILVFLFILLNKTMY